MADFILQQKINRMILKSTPRVMNMKKPEKFVLGAAIRESEYKILRLTILGNKTRENKRPYQTEIDAELEVLRAYLDIAVAPEARLISTGVHEEWSKEINEIGRLLGNWMKTTR